MLIVLGVKALKIIVSFAFMSRRTYQFSDMYYVTNAVYKEIYSILTRERCLHMIIISKIIIKNR